MWHPRLTLIDELRFAARHRTSANGLDGLLSRTIRLTRFEPAIWASRAPREVGGGGHFGARPAEGNHRGLYEGPGDRRGIRRVRHPADRGRGTRGLPRPAHAPGRATGRHQLS